MFGDFVEEPGSFVHSVLANVNMLFLAFIRPASVNRTGLQTESGDEKRQSKFTCKTSRGPSPSNDRR